MMCLQIIFFINVIKLKCTNRYNYAATILLAQVIWLVYAVANLFISTQPGQCCHVTLSYIMLTGYQMETDCDTVTDTVTSSWSCDEVPSVLSHSPGSAIVQQIPILDVTYTEEQCLRKTGSFIAITSVMFNFRFSVFCHFYDVDVLNKVTCLLSTWVAGI